MSNQRGPDYILDLTTLKQRPEEPASSQASPASLRDRPWIAVYWKCCHRYSRLYRNAAGTAYTGRCPACHRQATARVGPNGTDARFFEAG